MLPEAVKKYYVAQFQSDMVLAEFDNQIAATNYVLDAGIGWRTLEVIEVEYEIVDWQVVHKASKGEA